MDEPQLDFLFKSYEPTIQEKTDEKIIWDNPKLKNTIQLDLDLAKDKFSRLTSQQDLANVLEVPLGQLLYIIYEQKKYSSFTISKKSGGLRVIDSPSVSLSILQNKIKILLEPYYRIKAPVHGFVSGGRSIITNAEKHKKKKFILNIDLVDFFGSINRGRVRGIFLNKPFNIETKAANLLAEICTYKNKLPQGACTSPLISNLASVQLDNKLIQIAKAYHLTYTRYADDITLSSNKEMPESIIRKIGSEGNKWAVGSFLEKAIISSGFLINEKKTRLQKQYEKQVVTGLIVNERVNIDRKYIRNTRAIIHSWGKYGAILAERELIKNLNIKITESPNGSILKNHVYGRLSFIKMIRGEDFSAYLSLCKKILKIDNNPPKNISILKEKFDMYDVFICHASEDKESVAMPLYNYLNDKGYHVFIDNIRISWGDSLVSKINTALKKSKYVVTVISKDSINKKWPMAELNSVIAMDINSNLKKILPIFVGDNEELAKEFPLIIDKLYKKFDNNIDEISEDLIHLIKSYDEK
ncbi:TIR domain-containing protein [Marinomonas sp.]|uniref:TIR domain-containing protein n=1 Tax=Marinomonas sp. TaxID=1904862 RepID=UPI003BAABBAC